MRERLLELAAQRAHLQARAQSERESICALLAPVDAAASLALSLTRSAGRVLDQAGRYPLGVLAGVALLVALRPRRAISWLSRGWSLWRLYRGARGWWMRFESATAGAPK